MSSGSVKLELWLVRETDKARLFSTTPKGRDGDQVWLPRSLIEHMSNWRSVEPGAWPTCVVKIPVWLAEKEGLL